LPLILDTGYSVLDNLYLRTRQSLIGYQVVTGILSNELFP